MNKKIKIGKIEFVFVFKHRWFKSGNRGRDLTDQIHHWKDYRLGVWVKPYKAVDRTLKETKDLKTSVSQCLMIGIDLLVAKVWLDIRNNTLEF